MWHASVSAPRLPVATRRRLARKALRGVGDRSAEWEETWPVAVHLRRRLTADEAASVGPVMDLRRTAEGRDRWRLLRDELPAAVWPMALEELGE